MEKLTLEDAQKPMPEEWHGRAIRGGKKNFVRIVFPGMPKYWENGNDGVVKTDRGWKEYRMSGNEMRIIGY